MKSLSLVTRADQNVTPASQLGKCKFTQGRRVERALMEGNDQTLQRKTGEFSVISKLKLF